MTQTFRLIILLGFLLLSTHMWACPMCSVHNYMRYSIQNSSNIYLLEVSEKHPKKTVLTQVILGDHKTGEAYETKNFYSLKHQYSKSIVKCERSFPIDDYGLYIDQYSQVDIPEILWILKSDSVLHNDQEALTGILGLSNEYAWLAQDYCIRNYDRLLPSLIRLADSLNLKHQNHQVQYYDWRISNLHDVIFSQYNEEAFAYADKWISIYAADQAKITWPGFLYFPNEAFFLSLVTNNKVKDKYSKKFTDLIPSLGERTLSTLFYVLLQSGYTDPYRLEKEITEGQHQAFAVALYNFNDFFTRPHDYDKAKEYYALALKYAENKKLIDDINQKI